MARTPESTNEEYDPDRLGAIAAALRQAASRYGTPAYVTDEEWPGVRAALEAKLSR